MLIKSLAELGYPIYAVREDGIVINVDRVAVVKPDINKDGYHRVLLYKPDGKTKKEAVHRLVALSFIDNESNKPCVNHIDNNPSNNHLSNLEWCTHKENTKHSIDQGRFRPARKKLSEFDIAVARNTSLKLKQAAEIIGTTKQAVLYWRNKND